MRGRPGPMLEPERAGRWGWGETGCRKAPWGAAAALQPKRALEAAFSEVPPEVSAWRAFEEEKQAVLWKR